MAKRLTATSQGSYPEDIICVLIFLEGAACNSTIVSSEINQVNDENVAHFRFHSYADGDDCHSGWPKATRLT